MRVVSGAGHHLAANADALAFGERLRDSVEFGPVLSAQVIVQGAHVAAGVHANQHATGGIAHHEVDGLPGRET